MYYAWLLLKVIFLKERNRRNVLNQNLGRYKENFKRSTNEYMFDESGPNIGERWFKMLFYMARQLPN